VKLTSEHLPDRKRRRTEQYLCTAQKQLEASEIRLMKATTTAHKNIAHRKRLTTRVTREQWLQCHQMIVSRLFYPPRDAQNNWNGVITTDGISCSWHQLKHRVEPPSTCLPKKSSPVGLVTLASLGPTAAHSIPRHYGTHGDTVWIEPGPLTIVSVDPGHATLVDAVRYHVNAFDNPG
jgi:hypothetical protein